MAHSALNLCVLSKTVMSVLLPPPLMLAGCSDGRQWFIGPTVYEAKQRHCVRKTPVHMRIGKNTTPLTRHFGHICKNTQPFSRETNSRNTHRIAAACCQFWSQTWQFQVSTRNHTMPFAIGTLAFSVEHHRQRYHISLCVLLWLFVCSGARSSARFHHYC